MEYQPFMQSTEALNKTPPCTGEILQRTPSNRHLHHFLSGQLQQRRAGNPWLPPSHFRLPPSLSLPASHTPVACVRLPPSPSPCSPSVSLPSLAIRLPPSLSPLASHTPVACNPSPSLSVSLLTLSPSVSLPSLPPSPSPCSPSVSLPPSLTYLPPALPPSPCLPLSPCPPSPSPRRRSLPSSPTPSIHPLSTRRSAPLQHPNEPHEASFARYRRQRLIEGSVARHCRQLPVKASVACHRWKLLLEASPFVLPSCCLTHRFMAPKASGDSAADDRFR